MNSDKKYIINPKSGRAITYGGALHRRLIKKNLMQSVTFPTRKPTTTTLNIKSLIMDKIEPKKTKRKTSKIVESKEFQDGLIKLIKNLKLEKGQDGRDGVLNEKGGGTNQKQRAKPTSNEQKQQRDVRTNLQEEKQETSTQTL